MNTTVELSVIVGLLVSVLLVALLTLIGEQERTRRKIRRARMVSGHPPVRGLSYEDIYIARKGK